jgi:cysteine-rich repeat protein
MKTKLALLSMISVGFFGCPVEPPAGPACGNGILEDDNAEVCDDGNTANGDGCDAQCLSEGTCGNAVLDQGEECDEGAANGDLDGTCTNGCFTLLNAYQANPAGVAISGNTLFVSLIHLDDNFQPGDGEIVVIDRITGNELNRIPTSAPQPQFMIVSGDNLLVSNAGVVQFIDNFTDAITVVPGSIDIINIPNAATATAPDTSITLARSAADPKQGSLGRMALGVAPNDGLLAVVGSGLSSDVYVIDPFNETILRNSDNPANLFDGGLDTASVFSRVGGTSLYATSFNTDQSCFTEDTANFVFACADLGQFPIADPAGFEGLKDIAFTENGNFVAIFAVASSFASGTVNADGSLTIVTRGATGVDPERAVAIGNQVIIGNGFGNSLEVIDVNADGSAAVQANATALPAGSNPRDIVVEDQIDAITQIYVANFGLGNVTELDLTGGAPTISRTFIIEP